MTKPFTSIKAAIQVDKSKLSLLINQQIGKLVEDLPPQIIDMGQVRFQKKGDIHIDLSGQEIQLQVPLGFQFKGKKLKVPFAIQASIELYFNTKIDFQPYWQIRTETKLERYAWLDEPDVQITSILTIPVEKLADQLIGKNKDRIETEIDAAISDYWVKAQVATIAEAFFQKVHRLHPDFPIYLQLSPERIQVAPIENKKGLFHSQLDSTLRVNISSLQLPKIKEALPTPSFDERELETHSDIIVNVLLDYKSIETVLRKQLIGQSFSFRDNEVSLCSFYLKRTKDHLLFEIGLKGYLNGTISMSGMPFYEELSNKITMEIHDFDLKADSFWKQSVAQLFSGRIRKGLEQRLQYKLDDVPRLKEVKALRQFSPQEGVLTAVNIRKVRLRDFIVGNESIRCLLLVKAEMGLSLG